MCQLDPKQDHPILRGLITEFIRYYPDNAWSTALKKILTKLED